MSNGKRKIETSSNRNKGNGRTNGKKKSKGKRKVETPSNDSSDDVSIHGNEFYQNLADFYVGRE